MAGETETGEAVRGGAAAVASAPRFDPAARAGRRLLLTLRDMGARVLRRMYLPRERLFAFRLRPSGASTPAAADPLDALSAEGTSYRYTAITLLGLVGETEADVREILCGDGVHDVCSRLIEDVPRVGNMGDAALIAWAALATGHDGASAALARTQRLFDQSPGFKTVELAWVLSALCERGNGSVAVSNVAALRDRAVEALLSAWRPQAGVFAHDVGGHVPFARAHVACFADQVYPIQALARHYVASGARRSLDAALRCADHICDLQGPAGQWWWHYDARTGRVLEKYPVYYVHQDAMGPMALLDAWLARDGGAGRIGGGYAAAIERGLDWLVSAPELGGGSLMDRSAGVVWRKVARREPNKLSRQLQAAFSRLHAGLRAPALDWLFPPVAIDRETRPYQVGWLFFAWPPDRARGWSEGG